MKRTTPLDLISKEELQSMLKTGLIKLAYLVYVLVGLKFIPIKNIFLISLTVAGPLMIYAAIINRNKGWSKKKYLLQLAIPFAAILFIRIMWLLLVNQPLLAIGLSMILMIGWRVYAEKDALKQAVGRSSSNIKMILAERKQRLAEEEIQKQLKK